MQVYVQVHPLKRCKRITIPFAAARVMGVTPGGWVRLTVVADCRVLVEHVPQEPPVAWPAAAGEHGPAQGCPGCCRCLHPRSPSAPISGARIQQSEQEGDVEMIQVYAAVRADRRVTLPLEVSEAMDVQHGDWVRVTVLEDRRAVLERVAPKPPADFELGAAGFAAQDR